MKKRLLTYLFLFFTTLFYGQAFDGEGDIKFIFSFDANTKMLGNSVIFEVGLSNYITFGGEFGLVYLPSNEKIIAMNPDLSADSGYDFELERVEASLRMNFHFNDWLPDPEYTDVYSGLYLGKAFGFTLGGRYMFADHFGWNAEVLVPVKVFHFPGKNYFDAYEKPFARIGFIISY